jgi:hypothetical protein
MLGGGIGIATATRRHGSSSILRRLGGRPLVIQGTELPSYYDPQYGCEMEILRFDSEEPNPRYEVWINDLSDYLQTSAVMAPDIPAFRAPGRFTDAKPEFHEGWSSYAPPCRIMAV